MKHPYDVLQHLSDTSGKKDKLSILTAEKANPLLKRVIKLALDDLITFGTTKVPLLERLPTYKGMALSDALDSIEKVLVKEKLRGHAQRDYLSQLFSKLSAKEADVVRRVILKDLDCGVQVSTANKVWGDDFVMEWPVMLCDSEGEMEPPYIVQLKEDGMRINVLVEGKMVQYFSRNGRPLDFNGRFDKLFLKMAGGKDVMFDGEGLMMLPNGKWMPRKAGNGLVKKALWSNMSNEELSLLRFALWDYVPLADWKKGKSALPYERRLNILLGSVELSESELVHVVPSALVNSHEEANDLFAKYVSEGLEGIIKKDPKGPWENDRVSHQIKVKAERSGDFEVMDVIPHSKNPKLIGALVVATSDRKLVSGVGSGLDDEGRKKPASYYRGKIVEVLFNDIIDSQKKGAPKSLFLPRLVEVREDKRTANSLKELEGKK